MPKTQSALLEAMAEQQVTVDGETRRLAEPFLVHGDAEPDRVRGHVPAARGAARPLLRARRRSATRTRRTRRGSSRSSWAATRSRRSSPSIDLDDVRDAAAAVGDVFVARACRSAGSSTSSARRASSTIVAIGSSVRGTLALDRAARAWALLHGARLRDAGGRRAAVRAGARAPHPLPPGFLAEIRDRGWDGGARGPRADASSGAPKPRLRHRPRRAAA